MFAHGIYYAENIVSHVRQIHGIRLNIPPASISITVKSKLVRWNVTSRLTMRKKDHQVMQTYRTPFATSTYSRGNCNKP